MQQGKLVVHSWLFSFNQLAKAKKTRCSKCTLYLTSQGHTSMLANIAIL